jgi:fumarate hydratase class II
MKKFFRRLPALVFLAAGVSVAVLASREDGREKLSQFGESLSKGAQALGTAFNGAREFATDYAEKLNTRNDASYPSYSQPYQNNGSYEHKGEYSSTR